MTGNFRIVQIFTVFADRLITAKIKKETFAINFVYLYMCSIITSHAYARIKRLVIPSHLSSVCSSPVSIKIT